MYKFVNQILQLDVVMDLVQVNLPIVQLKLSVQQIDQLNVMMETVNKQVLNVILKLNVLKEKKDVLMDHVNLY